MEAKREYFDYLQREISAANLREQKKADDIHHELPKDNSFEREKAVKKLKRIKRGQAEEDANLARRVQGEKDLQKKEARTPPPHHTGSCASMNIFSRGRCRRMCSLPVRHSTITTRLLRRRTTSNSG